MTHMLRPARAWTCVLLSLCLAGAARAQEIRCPVTRDVGVSAYRPKRGKSERDCNLGAAKHFKLKFFTEFAIVDFDVSQLRGRKVERAWLYLQPVGKPVLGLNAGTDIRWLTVSTVSHDWVEGESATYAPDTKGHGATFNASPAASAIGRTSPALRVPRLPPPPFTPRAGDPRRLGEARVWALPEVTKVDPFTGRVLHEEDTGDFRRGNPVWDGASGSVRLAGARGEIVSFQVAVEGRVKGCRVAISDLQGPGMISQRGARLWRNWYVGRQAEYALPLRPDAAFDCPATDNAIAGQKVQTITVDYHIPRDAAAGEYRGKVKLVAGEQSVELGLRVKVYGVTIPDAIHFNPELNCYAGPGKAGSARFKDSYRLAHYHRCTINRVPYSQGGHTHADWIPAIDAAGHVIDWSAFDGNLGGLLDGSWFKDNPRAGVPVPTFYLPFYEGWPLDYRAHYRPGGGVKLHTREQWKGLDKEQRWKTLLGYGIGSKPIAAAMDREFKDAFVTCVREFVAQMLSTPQE